MSEPRETSARYEVYVWFEADPSDGGQVEAAFERLAHEMARGGSDAGPERPRVLRRPEPVLRDGLPRDTWMEVWPEVPARMLPGWLDRLEAAATASGAALLARGGRHVEVFEHRSGPRSR